MLAPVQACFEIITVDNVQYDVQISGGGAFNDQENLLRNANWFGNESLAFDLATAYRQLFPSLTVLFAFGDLATVGNTDYQVSLADGANPNLSAGVYATNGPADFVYPTGYYFAYEPAVPSSVPGINAGALSQVVFMLFALWLVVRRRDSWWFV
jgi:hypothetical protein